MLVSDFNYHLPPDLIAQEPLGDRAASRVLRLKRTHETLQDLKFCDFPELLRTTDLVVFNNSRVFPARLYGRKSSGPSVEVLLTRRVSADPNEWECLVRPGRKVCVGDALTFGDLEAEVTARGPFGERTLRFNPVEDFFAAVDRIGHVPLPPYIDRSDSSLDKERYQTVFARFVGSAAAPTAGLHFTDEILSRMKGLGIETTEVTLHVGLGTFQPIRVEAVEDHKIHRESYEISPQAAHLINSAKSDGRRVVAIGTTTVRTLEYAASLNGLQPGPGCTDIFIYPGYNFRVVDAMLTNFHLPRSTLLMLVCAFAGRERILRAYHHATVQKYRFYSYGDCMFLE